MIRNKLVLALGAVALMGTTAFAQGMGGPGAGGAGGSMRNSPKFRLSSLVRGLGALEHDPKAALSPAQARVMLGAIRPWQSKPHMNDTQARDLYMKLNGVLTSHQKNGLDKISAENRHFGAPPNDSNGQQRGRGMGMGGIGGGGAPSAADMQKMRAQMQSMRGFMQTMNPFYPPSSYPELKKAPERMRDRMQSRYLKTKALLSALAIKAKRK